MSELDSIKTSKKEGYKKPVKRWLKDIDLDHIAMTSGLGAASEMNEPFILKSIEKSNNIGSEFTQEEAEILKEIGEWKDEYMVIKSVNEITDLSIEADEKPNINTDTQKEKKTTMSKQNDGGVETPVISVEDLDTLRQEVMKMKKENEVLKSKDLIGDFIFSEDVEKQAEIKKGVSEILADVEAESRELLVKAFKAAFNLKVVAKSKTEEEEKVEENSLKKALMDESGVQEVEQVDEESVKKSLSQIVAEDLAKRNKIDTNKEGK